MFSDILLTADYDRTLTAPDSTIPQRNLEAIRFFMDNGGTFTVNTGRSVPMSRRNIIPRVPVNAPLLLYNGSGAYDTETGEMTLCHPLPLDPDAVKQIQDAFPDLNVEIQAVDAHYLVRRNAAWEDFCVNNGCAWGYLEPREIPGPFLKFAVYGTFRENTVASMYQATEAELARFGEVIRYIEERFGDQAEVLRACARIADVHARGCSKLRAARDLQKRLGKKILICVGDAQNDLSMLEGADYGFCPSDSAVADRFENVCECAQGAIADVIYRKIPGLLKISLDKP